MHWNKTPTLLSFRTSIFVIKLLFIYELSMSSMFKIMEITDMKFVFHLHYSYILIMLENISKVKLYIV